MNCVLIAVYLTLQFWTHEVSCWGTRAASAMAVGIFGHWGVTSFCSMTPVAQYPLWALLSWCPDVLSSLCSSDRGMGAHRWNLWVPFLAVCCGGSVNWIGLDLFNDDTCPPGHIYSIELYWIYSHSYQIIESSFYQKLFYASLWDRLKEGPQWVNCVVLIKTLLQHCTFQEYVLNCLATMLASSW